MVGLSFVSPTNTINDPTTPQLHNTHVPPRTRPERVLRPMAPMGVCAASPVIAAEAEEEAARLPRVAIPPPPPPRLSPSPPPVLLPLL